MSNTFADFVRSSPPAEPSMPFIHGTQGAYFSQIITSGRLEATHCPVFKEHLLYLFYGRPAYVVGADKPSRSDELFYPICFVFRPDVELRAKRVVAFDTGALQAGVYREVLHPSMTWETFELGKVEMSAHVVSTFFQDNRRYYHGEYRKDLTFSPMVPSSQVYYDLIRRSGDSTPDARRYTTEIQVSHDVELSGNVIAIALPRPWLNDPVVEEAIVSIGATPLDYRTWLGAAPRDLHGLVMDTVGTFLEARAYMEKR